MPRGSEELTNARKAEIVNACAVLYETRSFKEITLKEIGEKTSFTRTSIYNYFQTKEEIFLALFQREYEAWIEDLDALRCGHRKLSVDAFSDELARTLERRERLLKLMAMNHYDMEANSRIENLVAFKKAYGGSLLAVTHCLEKFFPRMTDEDVQGFLYAFFPFMFGIYPYTAVTEQQRTAMELAGVGYVRISVRELTRSFTAKLLPGISNVREEVRRTRRSVSCLNDSPCAGPARGCFSWVEAAENCGDAAFPTGAAGKGAEILEGRLEAPGRCGPLAHAPASNQA